MKIRFERNRTSTVIVMYSLHLYFLGLSLRNTSKALVIFRDENKRSYVSVWNCETGRFRIADIIDLML